MIGISPLSGSSPKVQRGGPTSAGRHRRMEQGAGEPPLAQTSASVGAPAVDSDGLPTEERIVAWNHRPTRAHPQPFRIVGEAKRRSDKLTCMCAM
jgi:hypothetical protein